MALYPIPLREVYNPALTTSRINTYKKTGEGGSPNWGCTTPSLALPLANQPFLSPLCFHILTNCLSCNPFLFTLTCVAPPDVQNLPTLKTFRHSEAALKTLRPSNFPTHGIIAAHGISEYPERHRSLGTSATSPSATRRAPARATARQRRTQTRNRLGRLPSGILEQRFRSLWPSGSKEFSGRQRLSRQLGRRPSSQTSRYRRA